VPVRYVRGGRGGGTCGSCCRRRPTWVGYSQMSTVHLVEVKERRLGIGSHCEGIKKKAGREDLFLLELWRWVTGGLRYGRTLSHPGWRVRAPPPRRVPSVCHHVSAAARQNRKPALVNKKNIYRVRQLTVLASSYRSLIAVNLIVESSPPSSREYLQRTSPCTFPQQRAPKRKRR
jgi:hypothetical protein